MSAAEYVYRYPADLTGNAPENHVPGEVLSLTRLTSGQSIAIPLYAPFFLDGAKLVSNLKGTLVKKADYDFFLYDEETSALSPKSLYSGLVILYEISEGEELSFDYQTVGHPYTSKYHLITQLVDYLNTDPRPVKHADITGVPKVTRPAHHPHPASDLVGFKHLIAMLERLYDAVIKKHLWDINTGKFTVDDRNRFIEIEDLLVRVTENSEVNQSKLDGLTSLLTEMYTDIPLPAYLGYVVNTTYPEEPVGDEGFTITFSEVPTDHTVSLEMVDGLTTEQTTLLDPEEPVLIETEWWPEGHYRIGVFATDGERRTMKSYFSVTLQR